MTADLIALVAGPDPRWTVRDNWHGYCTPQVFYRGQHVQTDWDSTCRGKVTATHWLGRCLSCSKPRQPRGIRTTAPVYWNLTPSAVCPDCGRLVHVVPVEGTVNEAKACNARCMGAVGPACDCSCGGENHGGRWG